jgi:hypothetical protein
LLAQAYKLANALRRVALPRSVRSGNLTTLREKRVKIGAKVVAHARYATFQLSEVAAVAPGGVHLGKIGLTRSTKFCPES